MAKLKANKPTADVLMNSMRAMGYSFEAAIADIVDNSVSAQARNIVLRFPIDPSDCCVAVCDDGIGMNKKFIMDRGQIFPLQVNKSKNWKLSICDANPMREAKHHF